MRTVIPLTLLAFTLSTTGWMASRADAASIEEKVSYFAVQGKTLAEIDRDLNRRGPLVSQTGVRHPGATEVQFDGEVSYKHVAGGCAVDRTNIGLTLNILLPRWKAPRGASSTTRLVWQTLEADIKRHENQHAAIAKNWLKRMEMALRNLQTERDCSTMENKVNYVTSRYLAEHQKAQTEFDTMEGREVNIRLRRALSRNISGYPAR